MASGSGSSSQGAGSSPSPSPISLSHSVLPSSLQKLIYCDCFGLDDLKSFITMVSEQVLEARIFFSRKRKSKRANPSSSCVHPQKKRQKKTPNPERGKGTHRSPAKCADIVAAPIPLDPGAHRQEEQPLTGKRSRASPSPGKGHRHGKRCRRRTCRLTAIVRTGHSERKKG
jgi:hypothetical protein